MADKKTKKSETKTDKIEREYVIPLRKKFRNTARHKKTPKAIKTIKEFLVRHMKVRDRDLSKIKIDSYLNESIWKRGIKNPPHKIKVRAVKEGDIIKASLVDYSDKLKFKKLRVEKIKEKSKTAVSKKKEVVKEETEGKEDVEKKLEEKKIEKEKVKAVEEATKKLEKSSAKRARHQVGGKTKEPKRQKRVALAK
jgi:large subunit ribosomal protein L31e